MRNRKPISRNGLGTATVVGWFQIKTRAGLNVDGQWVSSSVTWEAIKVQVSKGDYGGTGNRPKVYYLIPGDTFASAVRAVDVVSAIPIVAE